MGNPDIHRAGRRCLLATGSPLKHFGQPAFSGKRRSLAQRCGGSDEVTRGQNESNECDLRDVSCQNGEQKYDRKIKECEGMDCTSRVWFIILGDGWKWCHWLHHSPPVKLMQHGKAKHFIMEDINSPARRIYIDWARWDEPNTPL